MSLNKTRGFLYWLARLLGDVNAVKLGNGRQANCATSCGESNRQSLAKAIQVAQEVP